MKQSLKKEQKFIRTSKKKQKGREPTGRNDPVGALCSSALVKRAQNVDEDEQGGDYYQLTFPN
jgi:hypothetical protein